MRHTLPNGVIGPGFNDEFGDVFGIIYGIVADGFTHREVKDYAEVIRSRLMRVPDVANIEILGAQDEKILVEFSVRQLAGLGIDRSRSSRRWLHRISSAHPSFCRPATRDLPCGSRAPSIPSETVLTGHDAADLIAGAVAAASAAWASLRLFAPTPGDLRLSMLARLALRFPYHSLVAGMDVARRALDPRLPLRCGFILYPAALPPGPKRQAFTSVMSLLPGTVPAGANEGELLIDCLDVGQPVAAQSAAEEALFARVFGGTHRNG